MPQILEIGEYGTMGTFGKVKSKRASKKAAKRARRKAARKARKVARRAARRVMAIRKLRTKVEMAKATPVMAKRLTRTVRTASMKKAIAGVRMALVALANKRFAPAANIALNSAIEACSAIKENPLMAARVVRTARGVIRFAVLHLARRTV